VSVKLVERAAEWMGRRGTSRRSFLQRTAVVGSALATNPARYVLRPGTAYEAVCNCSGRSCGCGSLCCDGYTEFCCTITGHNRCPPGTIPAGWWKADGSAYCNGPRYYIDCNATCHCGGGPFCADGCSDAPWGCGCANGDCNNRKAGCVTFRYGQCNQQVGTVGRIACRVVSCDPAVLVLGNCAPTLAVDNRTANHNKPCLQNDEPLFPEDDVEHGMAVDVTVNPNDPTSGYTLDRWGGIHPFGAAKPVYNAAYWPGQDVARRLVVTNWNRPAGYVMDLDGGLHPFGGLAKPSNSAYFPNGKIMPFNEA
jgi:hypothetical protein